MDDRDKHLIASIDRYRNGDDGVDGVDDDVLTLFGMTTFELVYNNLSSRI